MIFDWLIKFTITSIESHTFEIDTLGVAQWIVPNPETFNQYSRHSRLSFDSSPPHPPVQPFPKPLIFETKFTIFHIKEERNETKIHAASSIFEKLSRLNVFIFVNENDYKFLLNFNKTKPKSYEETQIKCWQTVPNIVDKI